ncbi:ATP-binding protein [Asticcacaulis sp. YBE204]|uniref:ATP-binding protein n=1 Tax=Asticcacaulis sp. YBE204 TaxID=1282363 RepID=UPI0003C3D10A|nr:ATP-binding protein [Asticcacaulis sp. YBE204]ESQ80592.1 histidine kinase [Asticcacaulis sp. YBE204]
MRIPRLKFWPQAFKRKIPKTLWGRALLIIVLPVALMQVAVTWAFFDMHWETVTAKLSEGLIGDVSWAVDAYKADPTRENMDRISAAAQKSMQLSIAFQPGRELPENRRRNPWAALDRSLKRALNEQLDDPFWYDTTRYQASVDIRVKVDGGVIRVIAPRERAFATRAHIFILWMTGATLVLTAISILFIRNQVRAIERLSVAAEKFGRGEDDPNFKPYGAAEVRAAAQNFLKMKTRIQRHIEQRTTLLASVSHDLRTPLTRLKLELAMATQDTATERMKQDVSEMAYMIDEYLAFASGEMVESPQTVSVNALLETVVDGARRAGHTPDFVPLGEDIETAFRVSAISRALSNLVMNGFHYATTVRLSAEIEHKAGGKRSLHIYVDDDGPGIAPEKREDALKPFSRLDDSRNQNKKGVGLGLAIARDTVRSHGGELELDQSPMGGLRANIGIPLI